MKKNNRKKHVWWSCLLALVLIVTMLPVMPVEETKAATTEAVKINVTYGQTEARKLVDHINAVRQRRNQQNQAAIASGAAVSLVDLAYDYKLEAAAMERAAEVALSYQKGKTTTGTEMLSCLVPNAAGVCNGWSSSTSSSEYNIMIDPSYRSVGVGHVVYNGHDYWVALYSTSLSTSPFFVGAFDGSASKDVSLDTSQVTKRELSVSLPAALNMNVGDTYDLSKCKASIQVTGHYPTGESCPVEGGVGVVSSNTSVVSYNGASLVAQTAGTADITVTSGGQTYGQIRVTVSRPTLANATISSISDQNYTGYAITPSVTVKLGGSTLVLNRDYTLSYTNNTNVGTAIVTVTGIGNYTGSSRTASFRIVTPSVANATITTIPNQTYTGYAICPSLTVYSNNGLLREGTDYTVSYTNNVNIGTATVVITGIGRYSGTKTANFRINGPTLNAATIAAIPDQIYTGSEIKPSLTVTVNNITLISNVDYYASYSNNRNAGTATVTITGRGNYTGTRTATFRILAKNMSNTTVSSIDTQRYTGRDICPSVTVQIGSTVLVRNVDYTLRYQDNRRPGTASITIDGMGTYTGSKTVTFKIAQPSLSSATVKVSATPTYNGEEKMPRVTVKLYGETLEENTDYEIDYRNNIKPGKATVVVYGLGDYSGSKKANFVIRPGKPVWKSAKADGDAAVLSWKRNKYVGGYEVYRSRRASSGFRRLGTLAKSTTTKCRNRNLRRGTYYYKIRSYVEVNGRKYYSAYSKARKVKIK